jgi:hypothetical protein
MVMGLFIILWHAEIIQLVIYLLTHKLKMPGWKDWPPA